MPPVNVTVGQLHTGATVEITQDSVTAVPSKLIVTPAGNRSLSYSVTCGGITNTGTVGPGSGAAVVNLTAASVLDLTNLAVELI